MESSSPLDIGTVPSARVDRDMGASVLSSEINTFGFLDLIAVPDDENSPSGSGMAGSFEFETEDRKGEKITVKGKFSFKTKYDPANLFRLNQNIGPAARSKEAAD